MDRPLSKIITFVHFSSILTWGILYCKTTHLTLEIGSHGNKCNIKGKGQQLLGYSLFLNILRKEMALARHLFPVSVKRHMTLEQGQAWRCGRQTLLSPVSLEIPAVHHCHKLIIDQSGLCVMCTQTCRSSQSFTALAFKGDSVRCAEINAIKIKFQCCCTFRSK